MRSQTIIGATILLDAALFVVNLLVAIESGSHAVLSQAIYTIADLIGGVLILWGHVAGQRPPDHDHPFGYGKERFFWSFSSSLVTFSMAGLIVLVSGFAQVVQPQPVTDLPAAVAVVGATLLTSVAGIWVTVRELGKDRETLSGLIESPHQGLKTIFYQDLVSVLGSIVAFAGIGVVYLTHRVVVDGVAAVGMGFLLVATGFLLAIEGRELLVGKAISPAHAREILMVVEQDPRVRRVRSLQSMMLGPDDVLLALRVNFQDGLTTDQIETAIDVLSSSLRGTFPAIRHLVIEPES